MADLGYPDARTLLQSGNVVFTASGREARLARRIGDELSRRAGFDVGVLLRTRAELAAVVERDALGDVATNPSRRFVAFLERRPAAAALAELDPDGFMPERFSAHGREIVVWLPDGTQRARLTHAFWERQLAMMVTMRNWNTAGRLLALADAEA
jgi:uncharacterized protein (DUF1697 family)